MDTYYAVQNQKTGRWLLWLPSTGTAYKMSNKSVNMFHHWLAAPMDHFGWTNMRHGINSHHIKLARSDYQGYYFIYNKDCHSGDYPNKESNDYQIICTKPSYDTYNYSADPEYNWLFVEQQLPSSAPVYQLDDHHYQHNHLGFIVTIIVMMVILLSLIIAIVIYYFKFERFQSTSYSQHIYHVKDTDTIDS
ncbi:uncharacterized protein LOC128959949 [Oppia nitens]|uniref:uncharacterized protein LOC128959949 n=1 Tax=Oppia nitens TaxID=1686743 RepID=UPI0023DB229E|nr:uncharacterized protein LOC128959949 [Oppia nitens]